LETAWLWLTLGAAMLHALSFTMNKRLWLYSSDPLQIMAFGQAGCALFALPLLFWIGLEPLRECPLEIAAMSAAVVLAQFAFTQAMRTGDASFVVGSMGLKLLIVAGVSAWWLGETYRPPVYLGALGALAGLFLLSDGQPPRSVRAVGWVVVTCTLFGLIDVLIVRMVHQGLSAPALGAYALVGPTVLLLPLLLLRVPRRWSIGFAFGRDLSVYAVTQVAGLLLLMFAFAQSGKVTIVNIVQTSRALWVLPVVYLLGALGLTGLERLTAVQYRWRLAGALLMVASLSAVILSRPTAGL
jgi:drug/metabolite transporter (DMT)-like permease